MRRTRESRTRATSRAPAMLRAATAWRRTCAAVEPGGFGFAQGPPQPGAGRVVQGLVGEVGGQGVAECVLEPGGLGAAGHVVPDAAEHAEVIGAGQFPFQGLGRGQLAAVPRQDSGQHRHRIHGGRRAVIRRRGLRGGQSCVLAVQPPGALEFGGGAAAFADVGGPGIAALCSRRGWRRGRGSSRRTAPAGRRARRPGHGRCRRCGPGRRAGWSRTRGWRGRPGSGGAPGTAPTSGPGRWPGRGR